MSNNITKSEAETATATVVAQKQLFILYKCYVATAGCCCCCQLHRSNRSPLTLLSVRVWDCMDVVVAPDLARVERREMFGGFLARRLRTHAVGLLSRNRISARRQKSPNERLHTRAAVSARAAAADARGRTHTVQPINSPRACRRENTRNQAIAGIRLDPGPSAAAPCRRIQPITLGGAKQNEQDS